MKLTIFAVFVLLAILLGGGIGTLLVKDPGYVLISYDNLVMETSLWVAALLLIGLYLLVSGTFFVVRRLLRGQLKMANWFSGRKADAARSQTVRGLLVMAEGRWADAKKLLIGAVEKDAQTPLINYLNAARAAHELGEYSERDNFLKQAHESTPGAKFAVTLTQAEFNIHEGRYEQALAALLNLRKRAPKHGAVLRMLAVCYEALADWQALQPHINDVRKHKALSEDEILRLERAVWQNKLQGDESTASLWKKLPKTLRTDMPLLRDWVAHLVSVDRYDDAEAAVRVALKNQWDAPLVQAYGEISSSDVAKQLTVAQGWAKERPNDAQVSLTVGRLCMMNEKFEQARDQFEASLRLDPNNLVYGELGRLCVALGDERRGTEYLLKSLDHLADLPQPSEPRIRKANVS